jgi:hypothetical protein
MFLGEFYKMLKSKLGLRTFVIFFLLVSNSWAYQEIEVKNGGTLQGRATLIGKNPQPRVFHLVLYPNIDLCAEVPETDDEENRILYDFKTDESRGMRDVVITLDHVEAGKTFPEKTLQILSENCKFIPEVNVVKQGGSFTVDNVDPVMHNSQVYQAERGKIIQNLPVPAEDLTHGNITFQKKFKIFQMICGMHEFMQTWGYRVQNPYNQVTGKDGQFTIDNIPPGDYTVTAWHYLMKKIKKKIHVEPNATINLDFAFNGDKVVRPQYEIIRSGRIKKEARKGFVKDKEQ